MNVKELIARLQKFPEDAEIYFSVIFRDSIYFDPVVFVHQDSSGDVILEPMIYPGKSNKNDV